MQSDTVTTLGRFLELKRAKPFRPFRVHLTSGKAFDVADPEFLAHAATSRTAGLYQPDGSFDFIDLRLVTRLEVIIPATDLL